jgi:hypothetical protein
MYSQSFGKMAVSVSLLLSFVGQANAVWEPGLYERPRSGCPIIYRQKTATLSSLDGKRQIGLQSKGTAYQQIFVTWDGLAYGVQESQRGTTNVDLIHEGSEGVPMVTQPGSQVTLNNFDSRLLLDQCSYTNDANWLRSLGIQTAPTERGTIILASENGKLAQIRATDSGALELVTDTSIALLPNSKRLGKIKKLKYGMNDLSIHIQFERGAALVKPHFDGLNSERNVISTGDRQVLQFVVSRGIFSILTQNRSGKLQLEMWYDHNRTDTPNRVFELNDLSVKDEIKVWDSISKVVVERVNGPRIEQAFEYPARR